MRAKDVLLNALKDFTGTVVFVSHDRYFIDNLATRVFEVGEGRVTPFNGNYEDYVWTKSGGAGSRDGAASADPEATPVQAGKAPAQLKPAAPPTGKPVASPVATADDKSRRLNPIKLRQMKDRSRAIEDEITRLEVEIADLETALSNFVSVEQTMELNELATARRKDLEDLMAEWEQVQELLEANR
jgi:ATP-binding cassette subfamily F protein 3